MLNLAIIMGRLVRNPELRQTSNNVSTTTFSVAVERDYKKEGQEKETDFFDVVAWRSTAEFICNNFVKGQMIAGVGVRRGAAGLPFAHRLLADAQLDRQAFLAEAAALSQFF